jgi:serine/threonine-protein kinase
MAAVNTAIADPLIGRVLEGRYRIQAQLARGGMSTVYTAMDERLDRLVAVKVMSSSLSSDSAFTDRFTREARSAAKLAHLNAVSVYDQGTDGGHVFLVMELVSGRTLRELIRERGRLSPAEAVSIMEPVLGALAAAHRAGLVHRDVKPENILLSDDGIVKVADFGLARAVEADGASNNTGLMMGTVAYCSPEQISRGRADQRSDVYSSGIVLYELLTGSPPYTGDSAVNVAYQHVHGQVPRPSSKVRGIAPQLDQLVQRATDSEPAGRPLDAGAFLAELADVRTDLALPVVAVPPRPRAAGPRAAPGESPTERLAGSSTTELRTDTDPLPEHDTVAVRRPAAGGPPPPVVIPPPKPPMTASSLRKRRRRRALIALLVIVLLGAAAGFGGWWALEGRFAKVPSVGGRTQAVADQMIAHAGFKISSTVVEEFSETVAAGTVISSDPSGGSRQPKGHHIVLHVSKGQDRIQLPDVSAQSPADALSVLGTLRIKPVQTQQSSDTVKSGIVIGTLPPAGTLVRPGSVVQIVVSSGPPILQVPDVTSKTQAAATAALSAAGFTPQATSDYSTTVPAGSVIKQDPAGGSQAVKFSAVTIDVSKGPQTVAVPQITLGEPLKTAQSALAAAGLTATVVNGRDFIGLNLVVGINPAPGTVVDVGSSVTLTIV